MFDFAYPQPASVLLGITLLLLAPGTSRAEQPTTGAGILTLDEAVALSLKDQPLLAGRTATIGAEEDEAVAAAQLPDPEISFGIQDVPIEGPNAFSFRHDDFTEFTVGVTQSFPSAEKRRLQGERKHIGADASRAALDNDRRLVQREAALAWLDVYEAEQTLKLARLLAREADLQQRALEADYRAGRASQADWLAAKMEAGLIGDRVLDGTHRAERLRAGLARWIGTAARRPLPDALPEPNGDGMTHAPAAVDDHPLIAGLDRQIEAARTDVALAGEAYHPDISVEGYFAYRQDYDNFVGVQVTFGLPLFPEDRQDRSLSAAQQMALAAEARREDAVREFQAQVDQVGLDRHHYLRRVGEFDADIIPTARRRIDSARSAYAAGRGSLDAVLTARRALLDTQLLRLGLAVEAARAGARLDYFAPRAHTTEDRP